MISKDNECLVNEEKRVIRRPQIKTNFVELKLCTKNGVEIRNITKKDKEFHGFGLENIKKIIHNHNGELELDTDEEYFILRMIVPG